MKRLLILKLVLLTCVLIGVIAAVNPPIVSRSVGVTTNNVLIPISSSFFDANIGRLTTALDTASFLTRQQLSIIGNGPTLFLEATNAPVDHQRWKFLVDGSGTMRLISYNDAESMAYQVLAVTHDVAAGGVFTSGAESNVMTGPLYLDDIFVPQVHASTITLSSSTNMLPVGTTGLTNNTVFHYLLSITAGTAMTLKDQNGTTFVVPTTNSTYLLKPGFRFSGTSITATAQVW